MQLFSRSARTINLGEAEITCHLFSAKPRSFVICHLSFVICHLSLVTCHLSLVTCHLLLYPPHHICFDLFEELVGGEGAPFGFVELAAEDEIAVDIGGLEIF